MSSGDEEMPEKQANKLLLATLDAAPWAVWRFDEDGRVGYANLAAAASIGRSPADVVGQPAAAMLGADAETYLSGRGGGAAPGVASVTFQRRDGGVGAGRWLRMHKAAIVDDAGRPATLVFTQDITETREAEDAARESQRQCADIIQFYPDPTMVIDRAGVVTAWNRAMEELTGVRARDMLGKGNYEYALPFYGVRRPILIDLAMQPHEEVLAKYTTIEKHGAVLVGEAYTPQLGAGKAFLYATAAVLRDSLGEIAGAIESVRDITQRKFAEEEARRTNEKLADLVRELEEQGRYNDVMSEMREFLQACSSTVEIPPVILSSMRKLFPRTDGALFLLSPSRTELETVAKWGDFPDDIDDNLFPPESCWGLRRGRVYTIEDVAGGLLCRHVKHPPALWYSCLPLIAKGDVLGLLHLRSRAGDAEADAKNAMARVFKVANSLTEVLSLSIANIKLRETLSNQSIRDPLTNLFNRRFLEETLHREILRSLRKRTQIGVIMIDIDHFKKFNDIYGHAAGDLVLVQLAKFFRARIRESDFVCRFGGEEFTIIFPESSAEDALRRADRLREEAKLLKIYHLGQELGSITLSIGVSAYPLYGTTVEDLLRVADVALYHAKNAGRDRAVLGQLPDISTQRPE